MPTRLNEDAKPVVQFDVASEVSPFALFRALRDGRSPLLVDVRKEDARKKDGEASLEGAERLTSEAWQPPADRDVVLFDEEGTTAVDLARELQAAGHPRVRALFGGLALYEFALDPEVVGAETFFVRNAGDRNAGGSETSES